MGSFSIWHWMVVLVIVLLLFGRGKIPELMGDMAKGIKNFKKGMTDDDAVEPVPTPADPIVRPTVEHRSDEPLRNAQERATKL